MLGLSRAVSNGNIRLKSTTAINSTGSQTYTIPAGTLYLEIECWGAGGGGGAGGSSSGRSGTAYQAGGGGGGGGWVKTGYHISDILANDTLGFTVGAGGAGASSIGSANVGTDGGDTTLDTHARGLTQINDFTGDDAVTAGGGEGNLSGFAINVTDSNGEGGDTDGAYGAGSDRDAGTDGGARPSQSGTAHNGAAGGGGGGDDGGDGGAGGIAAGTDADPGEKPGGGGGGGAGAGLGTKVGKAGADGKVIVRAYGIG